MNKADEVTIRNDAKKIKDNAKLNWFLHGPDPYADRERLKKWLEPPSRQFFHHVKRLAQSDHSRAPDALVKLNAALKQTWTSDKAPLSIVPLEPIFKAHLECAKALVRECRTWSADSWFEIKDHMAEVAPICPKMQRHIQLGFLRDVCDELASPCDEMVRRPAEVTVVPFALVSTGDRDRDNDDSDTFAQFRFERLPGASGDNGGGDVFLAPEQSFLRMDDDFYSSCFVDAPTATRRLLDLLPQEKRHIAGDIRVRIEEFDPPKPPGQPAGKFVPSHPHGKLFFPQAVLSGRSASAAATWGLHFAQSRLVPDRSVLLMAQVDGYSYKEVNGVERKARKVATSYGECFDTIAVVGKANEDAANKGLGAAQGRIKVVRIDG